MNIYTCYSRNDSQKVLVVCNQLKELGIDIFDSDQLSSGEEFALSLKNKIVTSDYILFFYSEETEKSAWIRREIEYALSYKKKIIPILLSECPAGSWYKDLISTNQSINAYKGLTSVTSHILSLIDIESKEQCKKSHVSYERADYAPKRANLSPTSFSLPRRSKKRQRIIVISVILAVIVVSFFIGIFLNRQITLRDQKILNESVLKTATNQQDSIILELEQRLKYLELLIEKKGRVNYSTNSKSSESAELSRQQILAREQELRYQLELLEKEKRKVFSTILNDSLNSSESTESLQALQNLNDSNTRWGWIAAGFLLLIMCVLTIIIIIVARRRNGRKKSTVIIKCFIAGSKALQTERDALRSVISLMYNKWESKSFKILAYTYEDFEKHVIKGGHQAKYNRFIHEEASWALFIIDGKIGGITTEEYQEAMQTYKKYGHPKILILYKANEFETEEITNIRKEIISEKQYWTEYRDIAEMKLIFETTLKWDLINLYL